MGGTDVEGFSNVQMARESLKRVSDTAARRTMASREETRSMVHMIDNAPLIRYCAEFEIALSTVRGSESVYRAEVAALQDLAWKTFLNTASVLSWEVGMRDHVAQSEALLLRAETILADEATESDVPEIINLCRSIRNITKPNSLFVLNRRDMTLGVHSILEESSVDVTYQSVLLRGADVRPDARSLCAVADYMNNGETVTLLDGTVASKRELFLRALALEPNNWKCLCFFAFSLKKGETAVLADGTTVNKQILYLRSLALRPGVGLMYNKLGHCMQGTPLETMTLMTGEVMTEIGLYKRSISYSPEMPQAYTDLGTCLGPDESVAVLEDGTVMTKQQLYKRSIALCETQNLFDSAMSRCYCNLANTLDNPHSQIKMEDGKVMTQEELYKRAISIDPDFSNAYNNLGTCIPYGGTTRLENGTVMTKEEVFRKAVELNPNNSCAEENLSDCERYAMFKARQQSSRTASGSSFAGSLTSQTCNSSTQTELCLTVGEVSD